MTDLFTQSLWEDVDRELKGEAGRWWEENRLTITSMGYDEMIGVLRNLKDKGKRKAYMDLLMSLSDEEFEQHRMGTLRELRSMAARRAALAESLMKLGLKAIDVLINAAFRTVIR